MVVIRRNASNRGVFDVLLKEGLYVQLIDQVNASEAREVSNRLKADFPNMTVRMRP